MGIALGIASVASAAYGAHKQGEAAEAAKKAATGAAYVPVADAYKDQGYNERRNKQNDLYDRTSEGSEFGKGQHDLASMLKDRAEGKGNSLAQNVLQSGIENAQSAALGSASARPGAAGGLGLRNILGAQGSLALQGANQASQIGLQEQAQATSQLGGVLNQGRAGDQRQNSQMLAILQQQGLEDERNRQALMNEQSLIATGERSQAQLLQGANNRKGQADANLWGGIGKGFGNAAASGLGAGLDKSLGTWASGLSFGGDTGGGDSSFGSGLQENQGYSGYIDPNYSKGYDPTKIRRG